MEQFIFFSDICEVHGYDPMPDYLLLVPEMIFAAAKFIIDSFVLICGIVYFIKFRKYKKELDLITIEK